MVRKLTNSYNDKRRRGTTEKEVDTMGGSESPEHSNWLWHPILPSGGEYECFLIDS
jgi:hypothetical protein